MPELAVSFDECLLWARTRGATVANLMREMGCTRYRYYKVRRCGHWISRAVILHAAEAAMARRGAGFQTTLIHFASRQEPRP